jgi:hypothetical protein
LSSSFSHHTVYKTTTVRNYQKIRLRKINTTATCKVVACTSFPKCNVNDEAGINVYRLPEGCVSI